MSFAGKLALPPKELQAEIDNLTGLQTLLWFLFAFHVFFQLAANSLSLVDVDFVSWGKIEFNSINHLQTQLHYLMYLILFL